MSSRKIISIIVLLAIIGICLLLANWLGIDIQNPPNNNVEGFNTESFMKAKKILETSINNEKYYTDTAKLSDISNLQDNTINGMISNNQELSDSGKCSFIYTSIIENLNLKK